MTYFDILNEMLAEGRRLRAAREAGLFADVREKFLLQEKLSETEPDFPDLLDAINY